MNFKPEHLMLGPIKVMSCPLCGDTREGGFIGALYQAAKEAKAEANHCKAELERLDTERIESLLALQTTVFNAGIEACIMALQQRGERAKGEIGTPYLVTTILDTIKGDIETLTALKKKEISNGCH